MFEARAFFVFEWVCAFESVDEFGIEWVFEESVFLRVELSVGVRMGIFSVWISSGDED